VRPAGLQSATVAASLPHRLQAHPACHPPAYPPAHPPAHQPNQPTNQSTNPPHNPPPSHARPSLTKPPLRWRRCVMTLTLRSSRRRTRRPKRRRSRWGEGRWSRVRSRARAGVPPLLLGSMGGRGSGQAGALAGTSQKGGAAERGPGGHGGSKGRGAARGWAGARRGCLWRVAWGQPPPPRGPTQGTGSPPLNFVAARSRSHPLARRALFDCAG
jgi:hypothetical protein